MQLKDRVEQLSGTIQELRQVAGDGRQTRQLLDSLFRSVHSFKAAASAAGFTDLSRTAHEFENLLHALRTGKLAFDEDVWRVFDETVVALRGGSPPVNQLHELTSHTPASCDELPAEFATLKDDERYRAAQAQREGSTLYVMNVQYEPTDFDQQFRQLREQLNQSAEVISTAATLEGDKVNFRVVYAAKSPKIRVQTVFHEALSAGKAAATALGKQIEIVVKGDELLLDQSRSEALADALLHLVRNAVDHGIDSQGKVTLEATADSAQTRITITDDGRGIDPANLPLLFQPGFSTAEEVTEFSGRGVGLDVVATAVKAAGGVITVRSEPGKGASFVITLPNPSSDA